MSTIVTVASMLTLAPSNPTPTPMQIDHVTVEQSSDAATAAFIGVHPVAALATTVLAACECLPLIVDEFAGMECFSGSGE